MINKNHKENIAMPFIHIRAHAGRDEATKKAAAQAIVKAASEAMGAPEQAFTVVYEDYDKEIYDRDVVQAIIEPLRGKMLIERGKPL